MDVKPGYEQSEVGVIPEDWETDTLLSISCQIMDFRGRTPKKLGIEWGSGDIPALSAGNVRMGFVDFKEECYFGSEQLYRRWMTKGDLAKDDILFTTEAPLGNVALVPDNRRYILSQRTVLLQVDPNRVLSRFLFQVMLSGGFQRMLANYASGSTARGIQRKKFEQLCVPIPPLHEQGAIAATLSDVDALLGGLDRLIAKKRDLKQATLQQLLTGQTRLPGFSAKWVAKPLDQVGDIKSGGTPSTTQAHFWDGGVPWCTPTDITGLRGRKYLIDTARTISTAGLQFSSAEVIPPRSLIMTSRATIGECAINLVPVTTNQGFKSIVTFAEIDVEFLYYLMTTQKTSLVALCAGSTFLEIGKKQLSGYMIKLPKDRVEQEDIAAVLADMDAELAALEARRDKTRDLKQAMMQELLTGKTRLVAAGAAHA